MFARQLAAATRIQVAQVARYGVSAEQLEAIKTRCARWAEALGNPPSSDRPEPALPEELQPVTGSDVEPRELRCSTGLLDLEATPPQLVAHLVDGGAECGHVPTGGEQVDVLGRALDHAVFADRTEPARAKPSTPASPIRVTSRCTTTSRSCSGVCWLTTS